MDERRSYSNFAGSAALHGALLVLLLLGFAAAPKFADSPEAIAVETVTLSELNQIANGEKNAKPAPQATPAPPPPPGSSRLRGACDPTAAHAHAAPQTGGRALAARANAAPQSRECAAEVRAAAQAGGDASAAA